MGAIVVGLRPDDYKRLQQLAELKGQRPQDLAGIYLEQAIRRVKAPAIGQSPDDRPMTTAPHSSGGTG